MNTEVIERPAVEPATLKDTALASFVPIEAHLRVLAARYDKVAFDVGTPRGMNAAKLARQELREDGRYAVQRLQKRLKDEANDLKRTVDAESERLIEIVRPAEEAVQAQIEAREAEIQAEKEAKERAAAEAERIEAERIQRHRDNISRIRAYAQHAQGLSSARIKVGLEQLGSVVDAFESYEELEPDARAAYHETRNAMLDLLNAAQAREQEAARIEAQRIEQERIAAEQKAEADRLAAERAELERQREEIEARKAEDARVAALAAQREKDAADEAARVAMQAKVDEAIRAVAPVDQSTGEILTQAAVSEAVRTGVAMVAGDRVISADEMMKPADPPAAAEPLTLSAIGMRLGFAVTQAFLAKLGVQPTAKAKAAVLYAETLWPTIKAALVKHIEGLA